jgi:hypothetical protein
MLAVPLTLLLPTGNEKHAVAPQLAFAAQACHHLQLSQFVILLLLSLSLLLLLPATAHLSG